jgi:hypothetical protein
MSRRNREGRRVDSVWVLYPGDQFRFFAEDGTRVDSLAGGPKSAAGIPSGGALRGVGAISMVPGAGDGFPKLEAVLRRVFAQKAGEASQGGTHADA